MANRCYNEITITGSEDSITKIKTIIDSIENKNEFNLFESLVGKDVNYGTRDVSSLDVNLLSTEKEIYISLQTSWSPPLLFCQKLTQMYDVEIMVYYEESGNNFAGRCIITADNIKDHEYGYNEGRYIYSNESFWEELNETIEYAIVDKIGIRKFMKDYTFADKEDREEIKKMYKQIKTEIKNG